MSVSVLLVVLLLSLLAVCKCGDEIDAVEELFGKSLYKWNENQEIEEWPTKTLLKGVDVIGIYFSASWCGPCKQFTPQLAAFYRDMKKKGKRFEVIWVSRDRNAEEFVEYYMEMPWLAVTVENVPDKVNNLGSKYKMNGIPHFVMVDADDGAVINLDGRTMVMKDKYGLEFPWRSRSIVNILPKSLRRALISRIDKTQQQLISILRKTLQGLLQQLVPKKIRSLLLGEKAAQTV